MPAVSGHFECLVNSWPKLASSQLLHIANFKVKNLLLFITITLSLYIIPLQRHWKLILRLVAHFCGLVTMNSKTQIKVNENAILPSLLPITIVLFFQSRALLI